MKNYFKKFSIMFVMTLILTLGFCISVFAVDETGSVKINNTTLNFTKIIYVDANNGSDTSGNGSESNPFQSLWESLNYLNDNNLKTDVAIVMEDGDYDWTPISSGYSYNINSKFNGMQVSFIAKNHGKVFIKSRKGLEILMCEGNSTLHTKFSFYRIVFHDVSGDSNSACLGGDDWTNEYYNCVFDNLKLHGWNGKIAKASIKTINCLFNNCDLSVSAMYPLSGYSVNTASTDSDIDPYYGIKTTCLTNIVTDSNYNITANGWKNTGTGINPDGTQANVGVYGGEFAWGEFVETNTIMNTARAQGDNTNNASGTVSIIFHGTAETTLSVVKTADVKEVWVGDNFTYTIVVTNTGTATAKDVVISDIAPDHIDFNVNEITTNQGSVDSSSTSKNIKVNVGDIEPSGTVTIKIPVTVVE